MFEPGAVGPGVEGGSVVGETVGAGEMGGGFFEYEGKILKN